MNNMDNWIWMEMDMDIMVCILLWLLSVAIIPSYHADYTVLHFTSAQKVIWPILSYYVHVGKLMAPVRKLSTHNNH